MANIREKSPYAGMVVETKEGIAPDPMTGQPLGGQNFEVEDWWQNVAGCSWMNADGNPAALNYAFRIGMSQMPIPLNNEVLYGKIGMLKLLLHVSELCLPEVS